MENLTVFYRATNEQYDYRFVRNKLEIMVINSCYSAGQLLHMMRFLTFAESLGLPIPTISHTNLIWIYDFGIMQINVDGAGYDSAISEMKAKVKRRSEVGSAVEYKRLQGLVTEYIRTGELNQGTGTATMKALIFAEIKKMQPPKEIQVGGNWSVLRWRQEMSFRLHAKSSVSSIQRNLDLIRVNL